MDTENRSSIVLPATVNVTELKFIKGQKQGANRLDGELNEIRGNSRTYKGKDS
jgi:hypothetical protein